MTDLVSKQMVTIKGIGMGAYALYLKCNQLTVLTGSFSGDYVPRDSLHYFHQWKIAKT